MLLTSTPQKKFHRIMNVAFNWKWRTGFVFIFFFFLLVSGLLMSFHRHGCQSIMNICIQLQTWGASGHGCGNGASRFFFFFFWATGMVLPWELVPTQSWWVHQFIRLSSYPDVPITLKQGKSGLIRPHDLLPLLQSPIFMLPSKLKPFFSPISPHR